jgi:hypothetical protein
MRLKTKATPHLSPPIGVSRFRPEAATVPSVNQAIPRLQSAIPHSTLHISPDQALQSADQRLVAPDGGSPIQATVFLAGRWQGQVCG